MVIDCGNDYKVMVITTTSIVEHLVDTGIQVDMLLGDVQMQHMA